MQEREERACAVGTDQIVSAWEAMNDGFPFFAIFHTKRGDMFFQYNRDDYEGAKKFLSNNLSAVEDQGDTAMYYLKIYPVSMAKYPYRGSEIASIPVRLNSPVTNSSVSGPSYTGGNDSLVKMLGDHQMKQIEMVKEIAELKAAQQPMSLFDQIGAVLESQGASQTIVPLLLPVINGLMGIIHKISGVIPERQTYMNGQYQNPIIAGPGESQVDPDQKLDLALDRLQKHGDLVEMLTLLADFADKSPVQFKGYLTMLKGG